MLKIAYVSRLKLINDLLTKVMNIIRETAMILENGYGKDRNIDSYGRYVRVIEPQ